MKNTGRKYVLDVERAHEPYDIQWENLGISRFIKVKNRLFTRLVTIILLVICFGIILGVNYYKVIHNFYYLIRFIYDLF